MKKFVCFLAGGALSAVLLLGSGVTARAQSSGSFNYSAAANTACVLNNNGTGKISGGVACGPVSSSGSCTVTADCTMGDTCTGATACKTDADCGGAVGSCDVVAGFCVNSGTCSVTCSGAACGANCVGSANVTIKTNSGNDNVFVVRPSAVVGLLTDVTVSSKQISPVSGSVTSSALAGVDMQVSCTSGPNCNKISVTPSGPITYDSRFIQISTNLFQGLAANCTSAAGGCFITFNESTVSAHSFDFILGPLQSGTYDLTATWTSSLGDFGIANSMTCVGPVNLTVQQNKIFEPSEGSSTTLSF